VYAHKLDGDMPAAGASSAVGNIRWPRHRRIAFLAGAAALCWAVPILVVYLLAAA
jgi:hypothetical protein